MKRYYEGLLRRREHVESELLSPEFSVRMLISLGSRRLESRV
jgi:hypothetical protein